MEKEQRKKTQRGNYGNHTNKNGNKNITIILIIMELALKGAITRVITIAWAITEIVAKTKKRK